MHLIVYGDFNCPYSYLASQRVDELARLGQAEVEWRAVEHDPALARTGTPSSLDPERWQHELTELAVRHPSIRLHDGQGVAPGRDARADGGGDRLVQRARSRRHDASASAQAQTVYS